jgi:ankyrin repeat protein
MTVLHRAACMGNVETLKILIAAGGQIKSPCPSDDVVAEAVSSHYESNDRIAAIHYLLDHGADIDAYWGQNYAPNHPLKVIMGRQTALHIAIGNRDQSLVEMLLKRGADPSKPMWNHSTAYSTLKEHAGAPHWQEHINVLDPIEYARFLGFEDIEVFLQSFST